MTQPALNLFDDAALDPDAAHAVRRLAIAGFHALWAGRDVALGELVDGDATVVAAAVDDLRTGGRIECSDDGHVIAVHGLTRRPTPHRIEHHGGVMHTSCALDAIGIPAALAIDARALTHPTCGAELTVTLTRGEHPARFPVWSCGTPEVRCGHLVDDFCAGADLFCSLDHLEHWAATATPAADFPGRAVLGHTANLELENRRRPRYSPVRSVRRRANAPSPARNDLRGHTMVTDAAERDDTWADCLDAPSYDCPAQRH